MRPSVPEDGAPQRASGGGPWWTSGLAVLGTVLVVVVALVVSNRGGGAGDEPLEPSGSATSRGSVSASAAPSRSASRSASPASSASESQDPDESQSGQPLVGVVVLDVSGEAGLGVRTAARLRAAGWRARPGNDEPRGVPETTVYYPSSLRAAAQRLVDEFPDVVTRLRPAFDGLPTGVLVLVLVE